MTEAAGVKASVRTVWENVFSTSVRDDTDFFDLGGDSLAALSICAKLEESFRVRPGLRVLLDHPRFGDYADEVSKIVQEGR